MVVPVIIPEIDPKPISSPDEVPSETASLNASICFVTVVEDRCLVLLRYAASDASSVKSHEGERLNDDSNYRLALTTSTISITSWDLTDVALKVIDLTGSHYSGPGIRSKKSSNSTARSNVRAGGGGGGSRLLSRHFGFSLSGVQQAIPSNEPDCVLFKMWKGGLWRGVLSTPVSAVEPILVVSQVLSWPDTIKSIDATFVPGLGPVAVAIAYGTTEGDDDDDDLEGIVFEPGVHEKKRPGCALLRYGPRTGWSEALINDPELLPRLANGVKIARNVSWAVWRVDKTDLPTEASLGDLMMVDLEPPPIGGKARALTTEAGNLGRYIRAVSAEFSDTDALLGLSVPCTTRTMGYQPDGGVYVYGSDTLKDALSLVAVDAKTGKLAGSIALPYDVSADSLAVTELEWDVEPGHRCCGMLYYLQQRDDAVSRPGCPLVVSLHGGPCSRISPINKVGIYARYRDLLTGGYRVFVPAFSGTLGFGDSWSKATIGTQGSRDVEEVVTGIQHVQREMRGTSAGRVSLVGGSYGGYLALRCVILHPEMFQCVVARYPWVSTRWNGAETGDFTYEDEFWANKSESTAWPVPPQLQQADILGPQVLQLLKVPLLLMHGSKDNICPVSNSKVLFNVLDNQRGSSDGMAADLRFVVFPGEGHGFRGSAAAEANMRQLKWLHKFMPVTENVSV
ncbi:acylamino-acid-releasing enzyme, putative [Perkinsus marinus ATCC 50983]|uniref:Acylamino-acid-releasing enzyme, putative n=1 Tax=Perkinsus marinus (strain ATCC 50983 / TXsc) TaxID=423536 RepID=C5KV49_PERM5|nr:acylamino-acid-releasing enzyme, putative [Perkinsus marinus ATCC 50983]EER11595.1 acylamino-acid-releasing enzyme, putative [Perkinsus marinus ATCC 50983]|eukprot:XP_002779800.1 acylamino-acid-releasing enzyme, putative [Perkinsus marinus ATCC 50983]